MARAVCTCMRVYPVYRVADIICLGMTATIVVAVWLSGQALTQNLAAAGDLYGGDFFGYLWGRH